MTEKKTVLYAPSAEDTRRIGAKLAGQLKDGDTVVLRGEMGAGKSEFARGIARGLGYEGPIPSPSFTVLNLYEGGVLTLCHFDWYRLSDSEELYESGLNEYIGGRGVSVIEWSERAPDALPADRLTVSLIPGEDGTRRIEITAEGDFPMPEMPCGGEKTDIQTQKGTT